MKHCSVLQASHQQQQPSSDALNKEIPVSCTDWSLAAGSCAGSQNTLWSVVILWVSGLLCLCASEPQQALGNAVAWAVVPQVGCLYHIIPQSCLILVTKAVEVFFQVCKQKRKATWNCSTVVKHQVQECCLLKGTTVVYYSSSVDRAVWEGEPVGNRLCTLKSVGYRRLGKKETLSLQNPGIIE